MATEFDIAKVNISYRGKNAYVRPAKNEDIPQFVKGLHDVF